MRGNGKKHFRFQFQPKWAYRDSRDSKCVYRYSKCACRDSAQLAKSAWLQKPSSWTLLRKDMPTLRDQQIYILHFQRWMSHLCHKYGFNEKKKQKLLGFFFSLPRLTKLYQVCSVMSGFAGEIWKTNFAGVEKKSPLCIRVKFFWNFGHKKSNNDK